MDQNCIRVRSQLFELKCPQSRCKMANFAATTVLLLVYFHCSLGKKIRYTISQNFSNVPLHQPAITCHECVHMDTGERIACEDPSSAEVQTICGGAVGQTLNDNNVVITKRKCLPNGLTIPLSCLCVDQVLVPLQTTF